MRDGAAQVDDLYVDAMLSYHLRKPEAGRHQGGGGEEAKVTGARGSVCVWGSKGRQKVRHGGEEGSGFR